MILNKVTVPSSVGDGAGKLVYKDGQVIMYERGSKVDLYIFKEVESGVEKALCITVPAPITRAKCINAAEMAAYDLKNAMDVASFSASLSRKMRTGEDIDEVTEHDNFISQVKSELSQIGII